MALNLNETILEHKKDVVLDPSVDASTLERGMIMVRAGQNAAGEAMYAPSAGAASEVVAGILWLANTSQAQSPLIEALTVPASAPYTLTLREAPTAFGDMSAYDTDAGTARVIVSGAPGASQLGLAVGTKVLTADSALSADNVTIVYRFAISAATLEGRAGRRSVNNDGLEDKYGQVTIGYGNCRVFTSLFDTEDVFELAASIIMLSGVGGKVSLDGSGTAFGDKVQAPTMLLTPGLEQAYLGVACDLPG